MIVADASAILAILLMEPEREAVIAKLQNAPSAVMSPINYWEVLVRARALDGAQGVERAENLITSFGIRITSIERDDAQAAANAFAHYGRRTPADLNLGDCFAYALAKQHNAPLLFKGDDFSKTDIAVA